MSDTTIVLKYTGDGAYIAGVPACDLTQEMIDASGFTVEQLLAFNSATQPLYETVTAAPASGVKDSNGQ